MKRVNESFQKKTSLRIGVIGKGNAKEKNLTDVKRVGVCVCVFIVKILFI